MMKLCCECSSSYEQEERVEMMNEQLKIITAYFQAVVVVQML
jgi:hypothetical protein